MINPTSRSLVEHQWRMVWRTIVVEQVLENLSLSVSYQHVNTYEIRDIMPNGPQNLHPRLLEGLKLCIYAELKPRSLPIQ